MPNGVWAAPGKGEILYVEYWVNGEKVDKVKKGEEVEIRVVFKIESTYNYKVCIQVDDMERVCTTSTTIQPGTYYYSFKRIIQTAGSYRLKTWLYAVTSYDIQIDYKEFDFIVEEEAPAPPTQPPTAPPTTQPPTAPQPPVTTPTTQPTTTEKVEKFIKSPIFLSAALGGAVAGIMYAVSKDWKKALVGLPLGGVLGYAVSELTKT